MTLAWSELIDSLDLHEPASVAASKDLLSYIGDADVDLRDTVSVARAAMLLEHEGVRSYRESVRYSNDDSWRTRSEIAFANAANCLRMLTLKTGNRSEGNRNGIGEIDEILPRGLDLPFRLAASGLLAKQTAEVRLLLEELVSVDSTLAIKSSKYEGDDSAELSWLDQLLGDVVGSFILLVRKSGGWDDIENSMAVLRRLRTLQRTMEPSYLEQATDTGRARQAALGLVALFHLAQLVTLTGQYLQSGDEPSAGVLVRLDRQHDQAQDALRSLKIEDAIASDSETWTPTSRHLSNLGTHQLMASLLWAGCRELVRNALWTHTQGLSEDLDRFARELASRGRPRPILELWPSQQEALSSGILDQYRRAVLVQMPTSSGKSLLAEFLIIQSRTLLPTSTAAYIVPTRALVNQVTRDLRADLFPLGLTVEQAVPAYELDPAEESLLADPPNVLVTTPEKLSLLLRRQHPTLNNLGLVVVDEAHNLGDGTRGARLELLLSTIRRDRPRARFLLLSPFLPKAEQLVEWLGDDRGLPPITVNWRPNRRVVGSIEVSGRRPNRELVLETLDAAGNADLPSGNKALLGIVDNDELPGQKTIKGITKLAAHNFLEKGTTLVLCKGQGTAMTRAGEIADGLQERPSDPFLQSVINFMKAEYGEESLLAEYLRVGVAYHHGGMSQESRVLIESLLRRGLIHTVCGTTTLAQGVNFPISHVLIESANKGRDQKLNYSDLWNIVGRAGRAMLDQVGTVGFPVTKTKQRDDWQALLRDEAKAIASQLSSIIDEADTLTQNIGLREVRMIPALSDMLQFLAHAMRVGGASDTAAELEDLLRSSLVYRQARRDSPDRADQLVRICRSYLANIANSPGTVALSDQTGFSTPSIGLLLGASRDEPSLRNQEDWSPEALFSASSLEPLTARMRVLGEVPELSLGSQNFGTFSPERAAQIITGWVNGSSLHSLAERYGNPSLSGEKKLADFSSYLLGTLSYQASWGLGALGTTYLSPTAGSSEGSQAHYVPSMVYFGVSTDSAVWMRMAGLPRLAAEGAGALWKRSGHGTPTSYQQLREWLASLDVTQWRSIIGSRPISGEDMHRLWSGALS